MLGESDDLSNQVCEQWAQHFVFLIPTRLAPLAASVQTGMSNTLLLCPMNAKSSILPFLVVSYLSYFTTLSPGMRPHTVFLEIPGK